MRTLLALAVAVVLAAPAAEAQVLKIRFKDDKAEKKYKKYTCEIGGEVVLLGEPVPGGGITLMYDDDRLVNVRYKPDADNDFFVLDPADPSKVPYRREDGAPVATSKAGIVSVSGKHVQSISVFLRSETIETVGREYRLRKDRIDALSAERDAQVKGSPEWFDRHARLLGAYESLLSWLESNSFAEAAEAIRRAQAKEAKQGAEDARRQRAEGALASVRLLGTSEELAKASQEAGRDAAAFRVAESRHVRMTYLVERVSDERATELLKLAETMLEGFRTQFVDPYVGADFEDKIPEVCFLEFYFGPWETEFHDKFLPAYYGISWGSPEDKKRRFETSGNGFVRMAQPRHLRAWRLPEQEDLEGIVAHNLGHALADYHFNGGPMQMQQDWIAEGVGYFVSFEYLGRNSVVCKQFEESHYVRAKKEEGVKDVAVGFRDVMTAVALEQGQRIDRVMLKSLAEMESADIAKAWSFLDFVARTSSKDGQVWLRAACKHARDRSTFLQNLRGTLETMLGVKGEDVYKVLDDRWRVFAQTQGAVAD